ncbi:MAG: 4'-phosphopantetheinyl transferase superfamily protein [Pelolinea sp.]|nr:4'-phosphopantetheinyl transferase superfamily protein [Pelolinea sp.]
MEAIAEITVPVLKTYNSFPYEWKNPPQELALDTGQVHIWKIELDNPIFQINFHRYLSADEQLRAARIVIPEKRRSFQSARLALREILSIYTKQPISNIQFKYGPSGKPSLDRSGQLVSIEFNISHSENLMIAAFSINCPVGVDLEYLQTVSTKDWVVSHYFSKNDQVIYENLSERQKEIAFLTAWTKKEAYGKAIGTGFASELQMDHFDQGLRNFLPIGNYEMSQENALWYLRFTPQETFTAIAAIRSIKKPKPYFWQAHQGVLGE